jgi:flavin-dependent dehydrogenase
LFQQLFRETVMVSQAARRAQVLVLGGGHAGATTAALCAQNGLDTILLEREKGPRFHIGESLMPDTYWTLKRLGVLDQLKASRHTVKYSVQFVTDTGKESQPFYFFENNPHECAQTWQVVRSEFDSMLVENAAKHGATVLQGARALDVITCPDNPRKVTGARVHQQGFGEFDIHADVVVDATGQSSLISNKFNLKVADPMLRNASVWTYYKGASREGGLDEGATLVLALQKKKGWFWYIPLADDIVSVGVVGPIDYLMKGRGDAETIFQEELERCPGAKRRVMPGQRVTGFYTTKDFSYKSSQLAGDGWVLVGDAFGFLDPVYSSGVFLALKSGEFAADSIRAAFDSGDFSGQRLGSWGPQFLQGMDRMKRLVHAFYEGFNFGAFVRKHPEMKRHLIDLLIGDLFKDSVDEIIEPLDAMRAEYRAMQAMEMAKEAEMAKTM